MQFGDWSSDVCSSDLPVVPATTVLPLSTLAPSLWGKGDPPASITGKWPRPLGKPKTGQRPWCYEIDKHTDTYPFIPRTLHISHKSHSQIKTPKTLNISHPSIQIINDPINSSYHNDITPIPTSNDTHEPVGDRIYATPITYTPSKPHICYRGLYFHFIISFLLCYH